MQKISNTLENEKKGGNKIQLGKQKTIVFREKI